jgi:hypothetical protein
MMQVWDSSFYCGITALSGSSCVEPILTEFENCAERVDRMQVIEEK